VERNQRSSHIKPRPGWPFFAAKGCGPLPIKNQPQPTGPRGLFFRQPCWWSTTIHVPIARPEVRELTEPLRSLSPGRESRTWSRPYHEKNDALDEDNRTRRICVAVVLMISKQREMERISGCPAYWLTPPRPGGYTRLSNWYGQPSAMPQGERSLCDKPARKSGDGEGWGTSTPLLFDLPTGEGGAGNSTGR